MFAVSGGRVSVINTDKKNTVMQMQTAVTVFVNSKHVLLPFKGTMDNSRLCRLNIPGLISFI